MQTTSTKRDSHDKNYKLALYYLLETAEGNHAASENQLGFMHEYGRGVDQSYTEAISWYRKTANNGSPSAQNNLGLL
jgi:TPR repeat protein